MERHKRIRTNANCHAAPPGSRISNHAPQWLARLLQWFAIHRRPMPWRNQPSPYNVWVSEIMLQQTRVAAVIPYFERFVQQFPTVQQLAQAPQENVLKAWEGLGYYSRARNLHAAAQKVCSDHNGQFPQTEDEWHKLPGVGPYTAAAIASIANQQPAAAIDGNVMRVWSRLRGIREDISAAAWREQARIDLVRYARQCNPALFNQAMMELGALTCLPRNPACADCPLHKACYARRHNLTADIPVRKKKPPVPHQTEVVLLVQHRNKVLMHKRPETGLLAGLWAFPALPVSPNKPSLRQSARQLTRTLQIPTSTKIKKGASLQHAFTHFTQTLQVFHVTITKTIPLPHGQWRWCSIDDLERLPLSRSQRRIANQYTHERNSAHAPDHCTK